MILLTGYIGSSFKSSPSDSNQENLVCCNQLSVLMITSDTLSTMSGTPVLISKAPAKMSNCSEVRSLSWCTLAHSSPTNKRRPLVYFKVEHLCEGRNQICKIKECCGSALIINISDCALNLE